MGSEAYSPSIVSGVLVRQFGGSGRAPIDFDPVYGLDPPVTLSFVIKTMLRPTSVSGDYERRPSFRLPIAWFSAYFSQKEDELIQIHL